MKNHLTYTTISVNIELFRHDKQNIKKSSLSRQRRTVIMVSFGYKAHISTEKFTYSILLSLEKMLRLICDYFRYRKIQKSLSSSGFVRLCSFSRTNSSFEFIRSLLIIKLKSNKFEILSFVVN